MEFILLPTHRGDPPIPIPQTPYVCQQQYDGGPFLSYPIRIGKPEAGAAFFDLINYQRTERVNPTPLGDQESFIQTWLFFGFIAEFLCANSKDDADQSIRPEGSQEVIDQIYDMVVDKNGDKSYVFLDEETLNKCLSIVVSRLPTGKEARVEYCEHILNCISHAHSIFSSLPKEFNHTVKYAIAGLHELVAQAIRSVMSTLGVQCTFGRGWAVGYLNSDAKESMMQHGWCPSDIARAEAKFLSLQAMHVIRMMDRSLPKRDHNHCTDLACNTYQIDTSNYKVGHEEPECSCEELYVQQGDLEAILHREECIPLLRLTGEMQDLKLEVLESDPSTSYIAISHVWADGLGNPHANSLHRCKLARLRKLVSTLARHDETNTELPLIWLDTLCCPAKDGQGKQKAIEKIRLVYQRAKHVLVLDSGLMGYESKTQGIHEKVVRIFTSGWVRRLWTLQEGALARSIYFQFADEPVSLRDLRKEFEEYLHSIRHQVFALDSLQEFWRIDAFFKSNEHPIEGDFPNIMILDQALQFRSVSVASDEPLCIGTLMSLDLAAILAVKPKEDRMQKVWDLLSVKKGGIPAPVIFFEEQRIQAKGWRWAPQSLLSVERTINQPIVRAVRWAVSHMGIPTSIGLKVRFPGYRLSVTKYRDGKPRHPWPGLKRIPEAYMPFREDETGEWYVVHDKKFAYLSSTWRTDEERLEHNKLELFPLHDLADSDRAMLIMGEVGKDLSLRDALLVVPAPGGETERRLEGEVGLVVRTERHIVLNPLTPENGYIHTTIRILAMQLRDDEMTEKHLELYKNLKEEVETSPEALKAKMQESEEFKDSIKGLREKMRTMTAEVLKKDERLVNAVKKYFGASFLEDIWVLIQDFFNHDYLGVKMDDEQLWFID